MSSAIVHKYIDNKIKVCIESNMSMGEIIQVLDEKSKKALLCSNTRFQDYISEFSRKRIDDFIFIKGKDQFKELDNGSVFGLIQLRDKILGVEDIPLFKTM